MSRRHRQDTVSRLNSDGWVELYDPLTPRREFAGHSDGANEFLQGPIEQTRHTFSSHAKEDDYKRDPDYPWVEVDL